MDNKTGGPAFPLPEAAHPGAFPPDVSKGMTLLDYFAAKAMAAMLSNEDVIQRMASVGEENMVDPDVLVATGAYRMAEAMLAEREKRNG